MNLFTFSFILYIHAQLIIQTIAPGGFLLQKKSLYYGFMPTEKLDADERNCTRSNSYRSPKQTLCPTSETTI